MPTTEASENLLLELGLRAHGEDGEKVWILRESQSSVIRRQREMRVSIQLSPSCWQD